LYAWLKGSSETRNEFISAADFWISSDRSCVDDFLVGSDSVVVNKFCVSSELAFTAEFVLSAAN